jgi:hypothetical protein
VNKVKLTLLISSFSLATSLDLTLFIIRDSKLRAIGKWKSPSEKIRALKAAPEKAAVTAVDGTSTSLPCDIKKGTKIVEEKLIAMERELLVAKRPL